MTTSRKKQLFKIGSAAQQAGVSRQTLQYYLMVGLIEPVALSPAGQRLFDDASVDRIKIIKRLNENGYPLRAIRDLFMGKHNTSDKPGTENMPNIDNKPDTDNTSGRKGSRG